MLILTLVRGMYSYLYLSDQARLFDQLKYNKTPFKTLITF